VLFDLVDADGEFFVVSLYRLRVEPPVNARNFAIDRCEARGPFNGSRLPAQAAGRPAEVTGV
jgi:hypothetical protein